jgi:hypothetical protein
MQYIIRSFNVEHGQITVEYDGKWVYAIDLPIEDGAFPVGERLEEVIQGMAPTWLAERQSSLASTPANTDAIQALVQPFPVPDTTDIRELTLSETANNGDVEFIKEVINEVLLAKGL